MNKDRRVVAHFPDFQQKSAALCRRLCPPAEDIFF